MEEKICKYRECKQPFSLEGRRSDAEYCCTAHSWRERNERKKDNKVKLYMKKKLQEMHIILENNIKNGVFEIYKIVLDYLKFDLNLSTSNMERDKEKQTITYMIYDIEVVYHIELEKITFKIKLT